MKVEATTKYPNADLLGLATTSIDIASQQEANDHPGKQALRETVFFYKRHPKSKHGYMNQPSPHTNTNARLWISNVVFKTSSIIKRVVDIIVAFICLLALAPVFLTIMALIVRETRGCAFYGKKCIGRDGVVFRLYHFHTHRVNSFNCNLLTMFIKDEKGKQENLWQVAEEADLSEIGKIIILLGLERLPHVFNLFLGDISLFGPMAYLPDHLFYDTLKARLQLHSQPGLLNLDSKAKRYMLTTATRDLNPAVGAKRSNKRSQAKGKVKKMASPASKMTGKNKKKKKDVTSPATSADNYRVLGPQYLQGLTWQHFMFVLIKMGFFILVGKAIY